MTATRMTTKEVLIAARALIDTPDKWWQDAMEGPDGRRCASAALRAAGAVGMGHPAYIHLAYTMGAVAVCDYNDSHTHAEVMAAFDRAIASAPQDDALSDA